MAQRNITIRTWLVKVARRQPAQRGRALRSGVQIAIFVFVWRISDDDGSCRMRWEEKMDRAGDRLFPRMAPADAGLDIDEQATGAGAKIPARAVVRDWDPVSCRAQGGPT